jgi:hypothetical protein
MSASHARETSTNVARTCSGMPGGGVTKSFGMYPSITRAATCELGHGEGPRQR